MLLNYKPKTKPEPSAVAVSLSPVLSKNQQPSNQISIDHDGLQFNVDRNWNFLMNTSFYEGNAEHNNEDEILDHI